MPELEDLLEAQMSDEAYLEAVLSFGLEDPSMIYEDCNMELPECDDYGNFSDDEDDDRIDAELGV